MGVNYSSKALGMTLICALFVHSHLVFEGSKHQLAEGSEVLFFNCSLSNNRERNYAEFLVNNISTASLNYNAENKECNFISEEKRCLNMCKCFSDGKHHAWYFPMPFSTYVTHYSCHMLSNDPNRPEQAFLIFNGTDFVKNMNNDDIGTFSKTETTTRHETERTGKNEEGLDKSSNTGLYTVVILFAVFQIPGVMVCCLCNIKKTRIKGFPHAISEKNTEEGIDDESEMKPLMSGETNSISEDIDDPTKPSTKDKATQFHGFPHAILEKNTEEEIADESERKPFMSGERKKISEDKDDPTKPSTKDKAKQFHEGPLNVRSAPGRLRTPHQSDDPVLRRRIYEVSTKNS